MRINGARMPLWLQLSMSLDIYYVPVVVVASQWLLLGFCKVVRKQVSSKSLPCMLFSGIISNILLLMAIVVPVVTVHR